MRDALFALKMTLLAHSLAKGKRQLPRVNNREILFASARWCMDVQFARPMAALAADCAAIRENRFLEAIGGFGPSANSAGVAKQAIAGNGPTGAKLVLTPTGRKVPNVLLRIPANGRLVEKPVLVGQVRMPMIAGANNKIHFGLLLVDDPARIIFAGFTLPDMSPFAFDGKISAQGVKRIVVRPVFRRP